jgi:hypothetical protein
MKPYIKILTGILIFLQQSVIAQIEVGSWRDHFCYSSAFKIVEAGDKIYCATANGLFYYDKTNNDIEKLSKVTSTALSDVDITALNYSATKSLLVVGYSDGNIDIISGSTVLNVADIERKEMSGDKTINNIEFVGDKAYFACGFGIAVYDLTNNEFDESYIIGDDGNEINIYDVATDDSTIYAASESGIYKASLSSSLIDYSNWKVITDIPHYDGKFTSLTYFNKMLFASYYSGLTKGDSVYYTSGAGWNTLSIVPSTIYNLKSSDNYLILAEDSAVTVYDKNLNILRQGISGNSRDAVTSDGTELWVADYYKGLVHIPTQGDNSNYYPAGPVSNHVFSIRSKSGKTYVCGGGYDAAWSNRFYNGELSCFYEESWLDNYSSAYLDFVDAAIDPTNPDHLFLASWYSGIVEATNRVQFGQLYNSDNSLIGDPVSGYTRVGGIGFDSDNNLWMTNSSKSSHILVRKTDSTWKDFTYEALDAQIGRLIVTSSDQKWAIVKGQGLFVLDNGGTIDDESDDNTILISPMTTENSVSDGTDVDNTITNAYSIAEDNDGAIWVGTDHGVIVYSTPENAFDDDFYGAKIEVPRSDGTSNIDYLLTNETVTAIAVDGANRKWLGTSSSGVFLVSKDGTKQIHSFNTDNSPIVSNVITSISVNGKTGEVFIGTDKGLVSYRDVATDGGTDFSSVYVYPNPVRADYAGEIIISGMIDEAIVKITDIAGNIVYQTVALGGQAAWNGNNFSGQRVSTGVYLVFSTNSDGSKTNVTKLLFIH